MSERGPGSTGGQGRPGGPSAPVSVEESARGLVGVIERERGKHRHAFISFQGDELAW